MMTTQRYGIVGLGKMGAILVKNLVAAGGQAVVYDLEEAQTREAEGPGVLGVSKLSQMPANLSVPRVIWIMVPAGEPVDAVLRELRPHLSPGDLIIDGGNTHFKDSVRRAAELKEEALLYLDCGSSGGIEGARNGLCLMVGGAPEAYQLAEPFFRSIAMKDGYTHVGPSGAGHYVKMVHNAIEYGMLQAIGEGFELLDAGPYQIDHRQVADLWNHGSIIRSWLMELAVRSFEADPGLDAIGGEVGGGSTGSWAVEEALRIGVPVPAIAASVMSRLRTRQSDTFSGKVVAALRREFGGHAVVPRSSAQKLSQKLVT